MKLVVFLACALLIHAADSKTKAFAKRPLVANGTLGARIDALLAKSPAASRASIGIHVVDLKSGATLYGHNEHQLFLPASNMKLPTTALALERIGPEYRYTTRLVREPSGDVALIGSGDPSLSGRVYPYSRTVAPGNPFQPIEDLADQAVAAGLTQITGDIVGDDRLYPWAPYPPTWTQDDVLGSDGAPVSALSLADNVIAVTVRADAASGSLARLALDPPLEYFTIDNRVLTVAAGGEPNIHLSRAPGSRQLLLWGTIPLRGATRITVAVDDPALFAAHALYDALTRRGVVIRGQAIARHRSVSDPEPMQEGESLATRTSPPMSDLLQVIDKVSQNLHAELLLRQVGYVARHMGTREAGLDELASMLITGGAARDDFRLEDGSGLSRNAQLTPHLMTHLLGGMFRSQHKDVWMSFLPVGGEDGTLANRLCCSGDGHSVRAKTGSLARAITLSGYAESRTQGMLAFSILVNNFSAPAAEMRTLVDTIALALVE